MTISTTATSNIIQFPFARITPAKDLGALAVIVGTIGPKLGGVKYKPPLLTPGVFPPGTKGLEVPRKK